MSSEPVLNSENPSVFKKKFLSWYKGIDTFKLGYNSFYTEKFVSQVVGFFVQIVDDEELSPKVYFTNSCDTAAIDIEKREIWLSTSYLRVDEPKVDIFHTIYHYNGMVIHELGHLKYTKIAIDKIAKFIPEFDCNNPFMNSIYQIVEDLFVDNSNIQQFIRFSDFNLARFQYLFSSEKFEEKLANLPTDIKTIKDIESYINALVMIKNPENRGKGPTEIFKQLEEMFLKALSMADQIERASWAIKIYKTIFSGLDNSEKEKLNSEVEELKNSSKLAEELMELLEKLLGDDELLGINNSKFDKDPSSGFINQAEIKVKGGVGSEYNSRAPLKVVIDVDKEHANIKSIIVEQKSFAKPKVDQWEMSTKWNEMIKLMKAKSEVKRYYGLQNNFGKKIRQVHRIVTDGKVFADPIVTNGLGPQEIIILVDMSGSMTNYNNYVKALNEAWGLAMILESGRHKVSVFGHTADLELNPVFSNANVSCILYKFKSFEERAAVIEEKLQLVNQEMLGNNMDHEAINMVTEYFTEARNQKTLIVISDGEPASIFYGSYTEGITLTKQVVDSTRQKGINVISLSITEDCMENNNTIYGKDHNFHCDADNIAKQVVEYMTKG